MQRKHNTTRCRAEPAAQSDANVQYREILDTEREGERFSGSGERKKTSRQFGEISAAYCCAKVGFTAAFSILFKNAFIFI